MQYRTLLVKLYCDNIEWDKTKFIIWWSLHGKNCAYIQQFKWDKSLHCKYSIGQSSWSYIVAIQSGTRTVYVILIIIIAGPARKFFMLMFYSFSVRSGNTFSKSLLYAKWRESTLPTCLLDLPLPQRDIQYMDMYYQICEIYEYIDNIRSE